MQLIPLARPSVRPSASVRARASAVRSSGAIQWFSRARPPSRLSGVILRHVLKAPSLHPSLHPPALPLLAESHVPSQGHSERLGRNVRHGIRIRQAAKCLFFASRFALSVRADHFPTNIFASARCHCVLHHSCKMSCWHEYSTGRVYE